MFLLWDFLSLKVYKLLKTLNSNLAKTKAVKVNKIFKIMLEKHGGLKFMYMIHNILNMAPLWMNLTSGEKLQNLNKQKIHHVINLNSVNSWK